LRLPISQANGISLRSGLNVSYLSKLTQYTQTGAEVFAGTLGPCNITACSGTPRWRAVWSNTFDIRNKTDITLTGNFTSGYSEYNADIGYLATWQTGPNATQQVTPSVRAVFTADLDIHHKVDDHFTIYADVKNLLNSKPPFDPAGGYGDGSTFYMFNPAWSDSAYIGRFFRVGAKIDF
jgi:iron complex outermembrane receptor protein